MIPRRYGRIINVASIAGLGGNPPEMKTHRLQHDQGRGDQLHAHAGRRVGQVRHQRQRDRPGFFPSKMTKGMLERIGEDKLAAHAPLRRLGDDEDLKGVDAAVRLATPASTSPASCCRSTAASARSPAPDDRHGLPASTSPSSSTSASSSCGSSGGDAEIALTLRAEHLNSSSVTHGGAVMTLLDVAMARPRAAGADRPDIGVVTIEMKTSFMRPGARPAARGGRLLHRTATDGLHRGDRSRRRGRAAPTPPAPSSTCKRLPTGAASASSDPTRPTDRPGRKDQSMPTRTARSSSTTAPRAKPRAGNFKLVERRDAAPAGRPGAGAPPLPEPRPVHARPHERRQELRPAAAARAR